MAIDARFFQGLSRKDVTTAIGPADLLLAATALEPGNESARRQLCEVFGYRWFPPTPKKPPVEKEQLGSRDVEQPRSEGANRLMSHTPRRTTHTLRKRPLLKPIDHWELSQALLTDPETVREQPLEPTNLRAPLLPPPYRPLFEKNWFRAMIGALVGTKVSMYEVDTRRIVAQLSQAKPLNEIPWRERLSLKHGVQVLMDQSDCMQPFARDQRELGRALKQLLGRQNARILYFRRDPRRGAGDGPIWTWRPFRRPDADRPLIVVSDFGMGERAAGPICTRWETWTWLVREAKKYRCTVVAIVPVPQEKWSRRFQATFPMAVTWDVTTSPQTVSRIRDRAKFANRGPQ